MAGRPGGRRGLFLAAAGGLRSAERLQSSPLDWQTGYGVRRYHLGRAAHLPTHTSVLNCTVGVSVQCLRGRLQGCGGGDRWEPTWGRWDDGACSFPELEAGRNRNRPVSRTIRWPVSQEWRIPQGSCDGSPGAGSRKVGDHDVAVKAGADSEWPAKSAGPKAPSRLVQLRLASIFLLRAPVQCVSARRSGLLDYKDARRKRVLSLSKVSLLHVASKHAYLLKGCNIKSVYCHATPSA